MLFGRRRRRDFGDDGEWRATRAELPVLDGLDAAAVARLIELGRGLLQRVPVEGCGGLHVVDRMRRVIALQAALLVARMPAGLAALSGLRRLLLYPAGFTAPVDEEDEFGIVTAGLEDYDGLAMEEGYLVLNWDDVWHDAQVHDGGNLVLHECAHLIDGASGEMDGVPPLPAGLDEARWVAVLEAARADLQRRHDSGDELPLDGDAAENLAEMLAYSTELHFECPDELAAVWPELAEQLRVFYGR